jgi:Transposase DDE domain
MDPVELFYHADEFCKVYEEEIARRELPNNRSNRRKGLMTISEIITARVMYHSSGYKTVKDFFTRDRARLMNYFPGLVSYSRFVELCVEAIVPFAAFSKACCLLAEEYISYIDSTKLEVCHIRRASGHKTFKGIATKGRTSVGWFFGFKLHLVTNAFGNIIDFDITSGNIADNNASLIRKLTKKLKGKLFGDRGYLLNKELYAELVSRGLSLFTKIRSNMKPQIMPLEDRLLLQRRGISETIIGILKDSLGLEHARHRSPVAFCVNVLSTIIAYFFRPNKPTIGRTDALMAG